MQNKITVVRRTTESYVSVAIEKGKIADDYRSKIRTPLMFLNHMIEHIVWRSGLNVDISIDMPDFQLIHLVTEDLSMTLGKAVGEFVKINAASGYGFATGIIDEAKATAAISFEDRALLDFTSNVEFCEQVEGMPAEELITFLDGFCQGARCTLHIDIEKGKNGHHIWEAVYRAFGIVLGMATDTDEKRREMTSGVAGKVEYEVTVG